MKKIIMLILLISLVVVSLIFLKKLFFPDNPDTLYGDRLEATKDYEILNTDKVIANLESKEYVVSAASRVQGEIINIIVKIAEDTEVKDAKKSVEESVGLFSEETKALFDIQVFIKKETGEEVPTIGYKNKISEGLVWNN